MGLGHSRHRQPDGSLVELRRAWEPEHEAAGYHKQEWGPPPAPAHSLIGVHGPGESGRRVTVRYLERGATGPEFELAFEGAHTVSVVDEWTVREYLALEGIPEHVAWREMNRLHAEALVHGQDLEARRRLVAELENSRPEEWGRSAAEHEAHLADVREQLEQHLR